MEKCQVKKKLKLELPITLISLSVGVMSFILPIYSKTLNMDAFQIGGLFSIFSFVLLVFRRLIEKIADRVGRKQVLLASAFAYIISFSVFSFACNIKLIYLARVIQALAVALMGVSTYKIIIDITTEENSYIGFKKLNLAQNKGYLYGDILAVIILNSISLVKGWTILFIIFEIAAIIAAIIIIKKIPETQSKDKIYDIENKIGKEKLSIEGVKVLIVCFITAVSTSMFSPMLIIYLQDKFTSNVLELSLTLLPSVIIYGVLSYKFGKFSDKDEKINYMIKGLIICAVVSTFIPCVKTVVLLSILLCIDSIGGLLCTSAEKSLFDEFTNKNFKVDMYKTYLNVEGIGFIIGPILGGFLYEILGKNSPFYLNSSIIIIGIFLSYVFFKQSTIIKKKMNVGQ